IVYELGRFIGPALKPSERRLVVRITVPVLLLFLSGVLLCFIVVLPFTFNLLFSVQNLLGANLLILYGDSFIDFVLLFTVAFGLAFQLPVLMYGLSALGIVSSEFWKKYWRFAAIAIFLFGAIITPDGSRITMFLVALPMLALYVVGYGAAIRVEHTRARAKA
ncbi:MAG: twin-arginine translocase subunit TatC, partial [Methanobacteriota archaeon]